MCSGFYRSARSVCPSLGLSQPHAGCWGIWSRAPPGLLQPRPPGPVPLGYTERPPRDFSETRHPLPGVPSPPGSPQSGSGGTPTPSWEIPWAEGSPSLLPSLHPGSALVPGRTGGPRRAAPPGLGARARRGGTFAFTAEGFPPVRTPLLRLRGSCCRIPRSFPSLSPSPLFLPAGPLGAGGGRSAWEFTLLRTKGNSLAQPGNTLAGLRWPGAAGLRRLPGGAARRSSG